MPLFLQHAVVLAIVFACALGLLVRRIRVMRAKMSACSVCAYAAVCEKRGEIPAFEGECARTSGKVDVVDHRRLAMLREATRG